MAKGGLTGPQLEQLAPRWQALLQAMISLKLEGAGQISLESVAARGQLLVKIGATATTPGASGPSGLASSGIASGSSDMSATTIRADVFVTPKKAAGNNSKGTGGASSRNFSAADGSDMGVSPTSSVPLFSPASSTKNQPGRSGAASSMSGSHGDGDASEVVQQVTCLSIGAKYPTGTLGQSLTRIRKTNNEYTKKLGEMSWHRAFQAGTMKALGHRLLHNKVTVEQSMHIDLMDGFKGLEARARCLLKLHKAMSSWASSDVDPHPLTIHKSFTPLAAYLQFTDLALAPDTSIMKPIAMFSSTVFATRSVSSSLGGIGPRPSQGVSCSVVRGRGAPYQGPSGHTAGWQ